MLTAKEYYLWGHFMCYYYFDKDKDSCKNCPFDGKNECVAQDFMDGVDIDYLITEVEKFKTAYMKEKYDGLTYYSFFREKFPRATSEIFQLCPRVIYGKEDIDCPDQRKTCSTDFCWGQSIPLTFMPDEVKDIMEKYY